MIRLWGCACLAVVLAVFSRTAIAENMPLEQDAGTSVGSSTPEASARRIRTGRALVFMCLQQSPDPEKIRQKLIDSGAEEIPGQKTGRSLYYLPAAENSFSVMLIGDDICNVIFDNSDLNEATSALADIDAAFGDIPDFATYGPTDVVPGVGEGFQFVGARRLMMLRMKPDMPGMVYRFGVYLTKERDGRRGLLLSRWFGTTDKEPTP